MARYTGLLKLQGTIGDCVFYSINGKNFVRAKGQVSAAVLAKGKNYKTFRANGSEFGTCSRMGKLLRTVLAPELGFLDDTTAHYRLSATLVQVKNCDLVSEKGERSIAVGLKTEAGSALLTDFRFNAKSHFNSLIYCFPFFQYDNGKLTFSPIAANIDVVFVPGSNCLYLQLMLVAADFETGVFSVVCATPYSIMAAETNVLLAPISFDNAGGGIHFLVVTYGLGCVTNGQFYRMRMGEWGVDILGIF